MKKILFLWFFSWGMMLVSAQDIYVPDDAFEYYLETHDDSGLEVPFGDANSLGDGTMNDYVPSWKVSYVNSLDISYQNISDLMGIEGFTDLYDLDCSYNELLFMDVSQNANLTFLNCSYNILDSIELGQNTSLQYLYCDHNQLTGLDVSGNSSLTYLFCNNNSITSLNLNQNPDLGVLHCNDNQLTELVIHNGHNANLHNLDARNNPDLTCIEVDEPYYCNLNCTDIDPNTSFSLDCHYGQTYVPDDQFENYLETHDDNGNTVPIGDSNSLGDGVMNDYVPTDKIANLYLLNVQGLNIADLTGIEDFAELRSLDCHQNNLTSLDVSHNTALQTLNVSDNQLSSIDVSQNTALQWLYCDNNQLIALDVTNNPNLHGLYCSNNQIATIDLTHNTLLENFSCHDNQLSSLDISQNPSLIFIDCFNNQITNLDVSQNTVLEHLSCASNQLTDLDITQNTALKWLSCSNNQLTTLDLSQNAALEQLYCVNNQLTSLSVDQNQALQKLFCNNNQLQSLDLSNNPALEVLDCSTNNLNFLDIRNGHNQNITLFNALNNPALTCIFVDDAAYSMAHWTYIDPTSHFVETQAECDALDIADLSLSGTMIYPNPVTNNLNIHTSKIMSYQLRDITGKLIKKGNLKVGDNQLDISNYPAGIYILQAAYQNNTNTYKIIKQ